MIGTERYVFGSLVNGDFDTGSDVDVLVISDNENISCPDEWSVYTEGGIKTLYEKGSLFAWHLYLDAVPVSKEAIENDFLRNIGKPAEHNNAYQEVIELNQVATSSLSELEGTNASIVFELGLIGLAIRDIAMTTSLKINGRLCFSKYAPFDLGRLSLPLSKEFYFQLVQCRRATIRCEVEPKNLADLKCKVLNNRTQIERWINTVMEVCK